MISPAEIERIAGIGNPVLRNLAITQCYSELSAAVARRTGHGANWCTFATWASRQAGSTIRGEDMLDLVQARLGREAGLLHPLRRLGLWLLRRGLFQPQTRLGRALSRLHTPFDAFTLASDAVARGNRKVFAEIGLQFARYLAECPEDAAPDSAELQAFLDGLEPGEPPHGQDRLRTAFIRYQRERLSEDSKMRAELMLLANLEIGLHEQTRLQPEIAQAIDAPFVTAEDLGQRLLGLIPTARRWRARPRRAARRVLGRGAMPVQRILSELAREAITHALMVLTLPGRILALGADLPGPYPGALRVLVDAELAELVAGFEPAAGLPDDCGAHDWADLHQRMHYIIHLFRAFHASADLLDAPFSPAQLEQLGAGVIPDGQL